MCICEVKSNENITFKVNDVYIIYVIIFSFFVYIVFFVLPINSIQGRLIMQTYERKHINSTPLHTINSMVNNYSIVVFISSGFFPFSHTQCIYSILSVLPSSVKPILLWCIYALIGMLSSQNCLRAFEPK